MALNVALCSKTLVKFMRLNYPDTDNLISNVAILNV